MKSKIFYTLFFLFALTSVVTAVEPEISTFSITREGKALVPILVPQEAGEKTQAAAENLQVYLEKITGATFEISNDLKQPGIIVTPREYLKSTLFPHTTEAHVEWNEREDYSIATFNQGMLVVGKTELGVEHAVWDLLYQLGYRQYFPGEHWEIIPQIQDLELKLAIQASPDYHSRRIWYGYGAWDHGEEPLKDWNRKNRLGAAIQLNTGHAYGRIITAKQAEFDAHPEYKALLDGKRTQSKQAKFCISNAGLRQLVIEYAHEYFEEKPDADTISMDPSDGGNWCECEDCQRMGSVSDRALILANEVARAINKDTERERFVGMYAYNYHSPPPTIEVDPHVIISVATSFLRGGYTLDQLLQGWADKGAKLGIRDYYSVSTWDRDQPAKTRGSKLLWLQEKIPHYYAAGARFSSAESGESWGTTGLGHYFAARMLWDVTEADRLDEITDEFLTNCFGSASETMRLFYDQLNGSRPHLIREDQIARMYRLLQQAMTETDDQQVEARLNDLLLYTRFADLYGQYSEASGDARQAAFEKMIRHSYRARHAKLMHIKALYRDIDSRDRNIEIPEEAKWSVPEDRNPWKSSEPFSDEELQAYLEEGIERYQPVELDFEPMDYSEELVSAAPLQLSGETLASNWSFRGTLEAYTQTTRPQEEIEFGLTGGLIKHYRDRGNIKVELWKIGGASDTGESETLIATDRSVPPEGVTHTVTMRADEPGLYKLKFTDGGDMSRVEWRQEMPFTIQASLENPPQYNLRMNHYFYVPRGTKVIGFLGGDTGKIVDPDGKTVFVMEDKKTSFYSVPVGLGQDGKLWSIRSATKSFRLMTVPPYLAGSADQLLLPEEVLKRDQ
ncbi:hypothetical protein Pla110_12070 [Polystyrenella longa]|uniref:Alpha glucuronidase N-terminal domain-containing protein n=1 Tax=Polystyrenella longa TaxID=2528007 RepID=A0A518CJW0_9PLAN|nr:DUF4838 domain-containing protein [Polystyrenella longa]QDU79497.1 hypothetical protein Pla110_12070 [Polystyrenella longa]